MLAVLEHPRLAWPESFSTTLLRWADEHDHRLDRLSATEASLDEIFTRISRTHLEVPA